MRHFPLPSFSSKNEHLGWHLKDTQSRYQVVFMNLEPNASWPAEIHNDMDQIFIIVSGSGMGKAGAKKVLLNPGDVLTIPAGIEHEVASLDMGMQLWTIYTPVVPGQFQHDIPPTVSTKEQLRAALVDAPVEYQESMTALLQRMEAVDDGQEDAHAHLLVSAAQEWVELIGKRAGVRRRRRKSVKKVGPARRKKTASPKSARRGRSKSKSQEKRRGRSPGKTSPRSKEEKAGPRKSKSKSPGSGKTKEKRKSRSPGGKPSPRSKEEKAERRRSKSQSSLGGGGAPKQTLSKERKKEKKAEKRSQSPPAFSSRGYSTTTTTGGGSAWARPVTTPPPPPASSGYSPVVSPRGSSSSWSSSSSGGYSPVVSPRSYSPPASPTLPPRRQTSPPRIPPRPTQPIPTPARFSPTVSPSVSPPQSPRPTRPVPAIPSKSTPSAIVFHNKFENKTVTRFTDGGGTKKMDLDGNPLPD